MLTMKYSVPMLSDSTEAFAFIAILMGEGRSDVCCVVSLLCVCVCVCMCVCVCVCVCVCASVRVVSPSPPSWPPLGHALGDTTDNRCIMVSLESCG